MPEERLARIKRAQELLREIRHIPLATVNEDGSPHLSPVFMAFDERLHGYWSSNTDAQHSRNIERTGQVYLTVYDSRAGHGGLFMQSAATVLATEAEITTALGVLQAAKQDRRDDLGKAADYRTGQPLAIYMVSPDELWVNVAERDNQGRFVRDSRISVTLEEVLTDG